MMLQHTLYTYLSDYLKQNPNQLLYGLFDGVKYPMLWSDLEEGTLNHDMLFREEQLRVDLQSVAPYLVKFDFESSEGIEETQLLLEYYGQNGCIFMASESEVPTVLEAMRELFHIYTSEGDKGYMRFYEPKIFQNYIAQKDENIRYALFSEVASYWCEAPNDTNTVYQYVKQSVYLYEKRSISLKEKEIETNA